MSNNLNQPVKKGKTPPVPKPKGATGNEPASFSPKSTQAPGAKVAIEVPGTAKIAVADLPGQLEEAATAAPVQQPPAQQAPRVQQEQPAPKTPRPAKAVPERVGPRRVRLAVSRVDPWSVMKLSFLLSIAIGIMIVVASVVFWLVLDKLHVFTDIDAMIKDVLGADTKVNVLQFVELSRVVSLSTIISVIDIVLLTALGTIGAFLYNVVAALVGGIHLTLTDD